jgi:choline dehydrogenase-like flavoprotein
MSRPATSLPFDPSPIALAARQNWDVIVIGTGMGGGMAGRRLAERGLSVLFVEKGPVGYRSEVQRISEEPVDYGARQMLGFWPAPVEARMASGHTQRFFAPLGCGVGGSSVFYAAALEQPERHDLESIDGFPHPTGGWPVPYEAFLPYFRQAAGALSVRGDADPRSDTSGPDLPAPPLTEAESKLFSDLRKGGLHPYRAHEAMRRLPGCEDCLGRKCPRPCKMDARSAGVEPALQTGNATLVANCTAEELIETAGRISQVRVRVDGSDYSLSATTVVLAAGALHSPRLLLGSCGVHPDGCANSSGWVGRGLMFHLTELIALWPRRGSPSVGATRCLSLRDFYTYRGNRLGLVQSMGVNADAGVIASHLKGMIDQSVLRHIPGIGKIATVCALASAKLFGNATVLVGVMEDLPYFENRVMPHPEDPDSPLVEYRFSEELKRRRKVFRSLARRKLGRFRTQLLSIRPTLNFGHASGTLRFGTDPSVSVLDADCKAHDLANLYVTDASFMPTAMGVNPSLVIAANALRVADIIAAQHNFLARRAS